MGVLLCMCNTGISHTSTYYVSLYKAGTAETSQYSIQKDLF
jgi:hypothetical protein